MRALLVGLACLVSTEIIANNFPPLFVSPVWPTNSILLCALVVTPVRHWWAYALAGFLSSVNHNVHIGDPVPQILLFLVADAIEVFGAAAGIRLLAGGVAAFESPRNLVAYLSVVLLAPFTAAFVSAFAAPAGEYWALWRSWFLADGASYLTLAAAILSWIRLSRTTTWKRARARSIEAGVLGTGLLVITALVFIWSSPVQPDAPALMYLPLPFLLWAAVRFGCRGATASLAAVTVLAVLGDLSGRGAFGSRTPADNALSLQLFLLTISPPLLFLGVLVEEQERSQRALRRSEAQYRAVVEDQTELITRFLPDGTYTFLNGAVCRALHRSAESLLGTRLWDFVPGESQQAIKEFLDSLTPDRPVAFREYEVIRPGRRMRWLHWTTRGFFDDHGVATEYQAVGRDVTERKRAEDEHRQLESQRQIETVLRASEERFRLLADNAPVLIWMSDANKEAVYLNKSWLDFTGLTLEEAAGSRWMESIHPDDLQGCLEARDRAFAQRKPLSVQFRVRRHDGEYRWVLDNGAPYFGPDGMFSGYIGSGVDITAHKLAEEELEQAGRRKDEFLAMLAHELRNPLAPIVSSIELMRAVAPADETVAWAGDVIARQVAQLTRLVDDLLDVSRITRGLITLLLTPLELSTVVAQAVETSRPLIDERGHQLMLEVPSDPVWIRGDAVRLSQAISNLLNNAARYTPDGGRIRLSLEVRDSRAMLTVADNGLGLSAETLDRVFDLFAQFASPDRAREGLGIGLTLVKRLVELHGGYVEARSAGRGHGSEFIVRVPVWQDQPERPSSAPVGGIPPPSTRRRVLLVDDNVDAAEALSRIMQVQGQHVCVVHDGEAALAMAAAMQPEIVFLDLDMPKMSGFEVARRLRSERTTQPLVLVAITGFGQAEDRRRTAEAGFDHHLVKPIDGEQLRSLLASAI